MNYTLIIFSILIVILIIFIYISLRRDKRINNLFKSDKKLAILLFVFFLMTIVSVIGNIVIDKK